MDEIPTKFWRKWENADDSEKTKLIAALPLLQNHKDDIDLHARAINLYLEDLYEYALTKEKRKQK